MEEDVRSTLNDNINNFSNSNNTQSISRPRAPGRVLAYASLCLISAAIGGLSTIAAIPYIYPTSTVAPLQTANSSFTQVANYTTDQTIYPVAQIAKNVGPAVVGVANFQTGRSFSGKSALQEVGSGSGFIIDVKKGISQLIIT